MHFFTAVSFGFSVQHADSWVMQPSQLGFVMHDDVQGVLVQCDVVS